MSSNENSNETKNCWAIYLLALALMLTACSPGSRLANQQTIDRTTAIGAPAFERATETAVKSPWLDGNRVTTLVNGAEFYPTMLESARGAKKSITFETFAMVDSQITRDFVEVFCERADNGVKVHVILDAFGSEDVGKINLAKLRAHGVKVHLYHDKLVRHPIRYITRNHRKLMVIDGKVGYTGGCGVAHAWTGNTQTPEYWRENQYRVTGPVVAQMQRDFIDNWLHTGGSMLEGEDYFPRLSRTGNHKAQNFLSSPKDDVFTVPHLYRQVLASAKKSIIIQNSYYLPDKTITREILAARKRGVHVELILPGKHIDSWLIRYFSRNRYHELLKAGVHIYEYQKAMLHCKVMVVDHMFSSVGSANFDERSLYINDESNLNVMSKEFAQEQLRVIEKDKQHCLRIKDALAPWNLLTWPAHAGASLLDAQL